MVVSLRLATLHECATVYSVEDLHDLVEIAMVDAHNRRATAKKAKPDGA